MPKFKPNTSTFKMKGSPLLKDVKMYQGDGSQITVDDANLGEVYMDNDKNEARDYTYTTKDGTEAHDVLYLNKPQLPYDPKGSEGPVRDRRMIERIIREQRGDA